MSPVDAPDDTWPEAVGPQGPYGGYGPLIITVTSIEFAIATLFLLLRIVTRYGLNHKHAGWALSWTCISWFLGFLSQVVFFVAVHRSLKGFDSNWTVPQALTYTWIAIYFTFISIAIGKSAVIAFILSLQGLTHHRQRYFLYFLAISNIAINIVFIFFLAFRCSPVANQFVLGAPVTCTADFMAARSFGYFAGSWNAATDVFLAAYPIFLFYNLKVTRHVKCGIICVMALGLIASAMAGVKTWDFRYVDNTQRLSYQLYCILTWSFTEVWCVIITCSVPAIWPLMKRAIAHAQTGFESAKAWISTGSRPSSKSTPDSSWRKGDLHIRPTSTSDIYSYRGRGDCVEKDAVLLKHIQDDPKSVSRVATIEYGVDRDDSARQDSRNRHRSHTRSQSSTGRITSIAFADTKLTAMIDDEEFEVHEPERGFMSGRDAGRPGIVVTREYTIGSEKRKEDRREDLSPICQPSEWGRGKPMGHDWGDPYSV